jgi:hypothetical protein
MLWHINAIIRGAVTKLLLKICMPVMVFINDVVRVPLMMAFMHQNMVG